MFTKKRVLALLLAVVFLLSAVGCKGKEQPVEDPPVKVEVEEPAQEQEDGPRTITDMAGRTMEIPDEIGKMFPTGPVAGIFIYTFDPDRLLGWNYDLNDNEKMIILSEYHDLPTFGMGEGVNYEAVIAADPDIALNLTTINDAEIERSDDLAESLGIPVVMVDSDLLKTADSYRFLGELLSDEARGNALADYADKTFNEVGEKEISDEDKVSIYYGNGADSLETAPKGSGHAQIFDIVGAENVADVETESGSRVQISLEQLLDWNPDYIILNGEPKEDMTGNAAAELILSNPDFATLKAVETKKVFGAPKSPFSWIDRPPGPNRIVGIRWLAAKLYPEVHTYDVDSEVKEFYKLYYHTDLTDEMLETLYNG